MQLKWRLVGVFVFALIAGLALPGCDKLFQPINGVDADSAGGFYSGSFTNTANGGSGQVTALVTEDGQGKIELRFADDTLAILNVPDFGATQGDFKAAYTRYTSVFGVASSQGNLSGRIRPRNDINAVFQSTSGAENRGQLTLNYNALQYQRQISLDVISGAYSDSYVNQAGVPVTSTITVDSKGKIGGRDTNGCTYSGTLTQPNDQFNLYSGNIQRSCGNQVFNFTVLGSYSLPASNGGSSRLMLLGTDAHDAHAEVFNLER